MALGFTFNSQHSSSDFGIVVKSINRSMLPGMIKKEINIPGRHGTYDFSDNVYENRVISIGISYKATSHNDLREKVRDLASWLSQQDYCRLQFDDEPDKYYLAKVYGAVNFENMLKLGKTSIEFICQPHAQYLVSTCEEYTWGDELTWGVDIPWDWSDTYIFDCTGNMTYDIDYIGNYELSNAAQNGSKFNIIITGTFTTLTLALNGNTLTYGEAIASETITIDCINMTVKKGSTNKLSVCTGDLTEFFKLLPLENNTLTISGTALNVEFTIDFIPIYI